MNGPRSYIFERLVRVMFFLVNLVALYLLLRGHNWPGGGFIAGLASAISLVLLSLGLGVDALSRLFRLDPGRLATAGLTLAVLTGLAPMLGGRPFLEHFQTHLHGVPLLGSVHLGTPLLFDTGVYLLVVGITTKMILAFTRSTQRLPVLEGTEIELYSSPLEKPIEEPAPAVGAPPEVPHAT